MPRFRPHLLLFALLASACSKSPAPVRQKQHVDRIRAAEKSEESESLGPSSTRSPGTESQEAPKASKAEWGPRQEGSLPLTEHLPASIMVPTGRGTRALRVVVSAHGAGGRGIDHCRFWDRYLARDVLLVCPTGTPLRSREPEGGAYFKSHLTLRTELEQVIESVKQRWHAQLAAEGWLYLGYSQGATMGALALLMDPPLLGKAGFSQLVLVEGGGENWTHGRVASLAEAGGQAVGLVCGTRGCAQHASRSEALFEAQEGVAGLSRVVAGGGHTYGGQVTPAVQDVLLRFGYGPSPATP